MKKLLLITFLFTFPLTLFGEDPPEMRAVYIAMWTLNSQSECQKAVADILASNINAVFVQVRGRGDAYYFPNREDDTYPNQEPRSLLYPISPTGFDPLQYLIDRFHNADPPVEVHAWCTTYNCWNRSSPPSSPNHVLNLHPEWVTNKKDGASYIDASDIPLDPGIPDVQDYIYNVFMDIVRNYDVDGIHFDYIRLLNADSGYNPMAKAKFKAETGWDFDTDNSKGQLEEVYEAWRRDQLARLVQRVHDRTMLEKPRADVSTFLVHFTDPVENLAQGFNWWAAHKAVDALHPSCYSDSVSGNRSNWNTAINRLKENGDEYTVPVVAAIGEYLLTSTELVQTVNELRANSRKPDGFNFFRYGTMFAGSPSKADDMFDPGGPMDDWAPLPAKPGEDNVPPNPPANLSVSLTGNTPRIAFQKPAPATDGELPVHYRLYRDTQTPVRTYFENMVMEWWDPGSARTDFTVNDLTPPDGTAFYAAVSYDDWDNPAVSEAGPFSTTGSYIIETRSGGKNTGDYSEESGSFFNSSSHSDAPGCTDGIGSRFSLPHDGKNDRARFTPSSLSTGKYNVYVTCFNYSSANAPGITVRVNDSSGISTSAFDLTRSNCGDQWAKCASIDYAAGQGHYIEFDSSTQLSSGSNDRMNPAAVKFTPTGTIVKEPKPPVTESSSIVTEVIVDSEPTALDYDDPEGSGAWLTTTWGDNYGGSARYYNDSNYPMDSYAVWIVDLPRAGYWAIAGYIRSNQGSLARGVKYRFVDGNGDIKNTVATLQTGTGGFTVNVDGVADQEACLFNKGRVYVTLYGNATGNEMIIADALRFRLVKPLVATSSSGWMLY